MSRDYIELWPNQVVGNTTFTGAIKWVVSLEGYSVSFERTASINKTLGRTLDVTLGSTVEKHNYILKVKHTPDTGYGSFYQISEMFKLDEIIDNPPTPSFKLNFKDHNATNEEGYRVAILVGGLEKRVTSVVVDSSAVYLVPITILVYDTTQNETSMTTSKLLSAWTSGKYYHITTAVYNVDGVITSGTVVWPDGNTGLYTSDTINATFNCVDEYTLTWFDGSTTYTINQPLVTRDAYGNATTIPELVIT